MQMSSAVKVEFHCKWLAVEKRSGKAPAALVKYVVFSCKRWANTKILQTECRGDRIPQRMSWSVNLSPLWIIRDQGQSLKSTSGSLMLVFFIFAKKQRCFSCFNTGKL